MGRAAPDAAPLAPDPVATDAVSVKVHPVQPSPDHGQWLAAKHLRKANARRRVKSEPTTTSRHVHWDLESTVVHLYELPTPGRRRRNKSPKPIKLLSVPQRFDGTENPNLSPERISSPLVHGSKKHTAHNAVRKSLNFDDQTTKKDDGTESQESDDEGALLSSPCPSPPPPEGTDSFESTDTDTTDTDTDADYSDKENAHHRPNSEDDNEHDDDHDDDDGDDGDCNDVSGQHAHHSKSKRKTKRQRKRARQKQQQAYFAEIQDQTGILDDHHRRFETASPTGASNWTLLFSVTLVPVCVFAAAAASYTVW